MKPHLIKTTWGWAVFHNRDVCKWKLAIVIGETVDQACKKYVDYMEG